MACFDLYGGEVNCNWDSCVGGYDGDSCEGEFSPENWSGEVNINETGLTGFTQMTQDEFFDWFQELHPWGETLEGWVMPGEDVVVPELITWGEAQDFAEMFQGYDATQELYILGALAENTYNANEMYDQWVNTAQVNLHEKLEREWDIKENKQRQTSLQHGISKNTQDFSKRIENMKLADKQKQISSAKASGKNVKYQEEALDLSLSQLMEEYLNSKNLQEQQLLNEIDNLDQQWTDATLVSQSSLEQLINQKRLSKDRAIMNEEHAAKKKVYALRDSYEAGIWDMIGEFGHHQAFLEAGDWDG